MANLYGVLMAGGTGTRFWPRSRKASPKQVLNIVQERTMIQATVDRLEGLVDANRLLIVTNAQQKVLINEQLPELADENFVLEPFGRNTAPCIGLAAAHIAAHDPDGVMVVLPADHLITDVKTFQSALQTAADHAVEHDGLVTLGIMPYEPATGYGYIQSGDQVAENNGHAVYRVQSFAEKPNLETAKRFLESGGFFWNSGMFIWKASTILKEISQQLPDIYEPLQEVQACIGQDNYQAKLEEMYQQIRGISIDFGVMQEASNVFVIPTEMGWNDVGSWATVYDISEKDEQGVASETKNLINVDSKNCYAYSPDKAVALVGVEDLMVVDTGDAILICKRDAAQSVKDVVESLKKNGQDHYL